MYNFVLRSTTITHMQPFTGYEGVEFFSLVQINTLLTNGFGLFNKSDGVVRDRHVGRFVIFLKNRITLKSFFKVARPTIGNKTENTFQLKFQETKMTKLTKNEKKMYLVPRPFGPRSIVNVMKMYFGGKMNRVFYL